VLLTRGLVVGVYTVHVHLVLEYMYCRCDRHMWLYMLAVSLLYCRLVASRGVRLKTNEPKQTKQVRCGFFAI